MSVAESNETRLLRNHPHIEDHSVTNKWLHVICLPLLLAHAVEAAQPVQAWQEFGWNQSSPEALRTAERLLRDDPDSVPGLWLKGRFLVGMGEYSHAVPVLKKALKQLAVHQPPDTNWYPLCTHALAEALYCAGKPAAASRTWAAFPHLGWERQEEQLNISYPVALWRSACFLRLGKTPEAATLLRAAQGTNARQQYLVDLERLRFANHIGGTGSALRKAREIWRSYPEAKEDADFLSCHAALLLADGEPTETAAAVLKRASDVDRPSSVSNPSSLLLRLDVAAGNWSYAVDRAVEAWVACRRRRADLRLRLETENWVGITQFYLVCGYPDQALEVARLAGFADRPPRAGYTAGDPAAWRVAADATEATALGDYVEVLREHRPFLRRSEWCNSWREEFVCRVRLGHLLLRIRRGISQQLSAQSAPASSLLDLAPLPAWAWPIMAQAMGQRCATDLLHERPVPSGKGPWFTNYLETLLARSAGDRLRAIDHATVALAHVPQQEKLIAAQLHAIVGESAWTLRRPYASSYLATAFQLAPSVLRTLRIRLPVTLDADNPALAKELSRRFCFADRASICLTLRGEAGGIAFSLKNGSDSLRSGRVQHLHELQDELFRCVPLGVVDHQKLTNRATPLE